MRLIEAPETSKSSTEAHRHKTATVTQGQNPAPDAGVVKRMRLELANFLVALVALFFGVMYNAASSMAVWAIIRCGRQGQKTKMSN